MPAIRGPKNQPDFLLVFRGLQNQGIFNRASFMIEGEALTTFSNDFQSFGIFSTPA